MNLVSVFRFRLHWINLPGALLVALLQRTPLLRVAATTGEMIVASPAGAVLRSAITAVASLGAVHALAGATQFVVSKNPVTGTVGSVITPVSFTVTGAAVPPGSFRLIGSLPPGLILAGANSSGVVSTSIGAITGTPTAAGNFSVSILAFELSGAQGDQFGPLNLTFNISGAAAVAPTITAQPLSQTLNVGDVLTLTVAASGTPTLNYQWRRNNFDISGATGATLTINNVTFNDAGSYSVAVSNSAGNVTSSAAAITIVNATTAPSFTLQPVAQTVANGSTVVFSVAAGGSPAPSLQWRRNGVSIAGATSSTLVLSGATTSAGAYSCVASNSAGNATSSPATLTLSSTTDVGRLINLAIRTNAGTGDQTLFVGFAIGGGVTGDVKPLLLRGVGPSLALFGLTGVLADPFATVFKDSTQMASNDNWAGDAQVRNRAAQVGAFGFASDASLDAALALSPSAGLYSVKVTGNNNGTGLALAEIYDATPGGAFTPATVRLINVSARAQVGTGDNILIAGFVVGGSTAKTVLIRAAGPGLAAFGLGGTLVDPKLQLFSGATVIRENDDWGGDPQLADIGSGVGAFALPGATSKDAVLLVTLPPGNYTAQVSGANNGTGVALVEVYEVP